MNNWAQCALTGTAIQSLEVLLVTDKIEVIAIGIKAKAHAYEI